MRWSILSQSKAILCGRPKIRPNGSISIAKSPSAPASVWAAYPIRSVVAGCAVLIGLTIAATWILLTNLRNEQITQSERDLPAAAGIIALMIGGAAFFISRRIESNLQAQNRRLDAALNNMSQGLVMFDSAGRIIVCNDRYLQMYGLARDAVTPGCTLQDLVRIRVANGTFSRDAFTDPDQYVSGLMAEIVREKPTSIVCELNDGRVIAIVNRPMPGGGWVATHEDITEARRHEASFRLLFESNPVPMWVYDVENFHFLAVNNAAVAHYGYGREQFLAMTVLDIRPTADREHLLQAIKGRGAILEGERTWCHIKADGNKIDVCVYARALSYDGRKARLVAVHDITDRKRVEEHLRRTEKFLDTLIENVPVPILVKDVANSASDASMCRYTLANKACEDLFGAPREQIVGKTIAELYPKERADFIIAENNATLRSDHPVVLSDHPVQTFTNGVRIATATSVAIRDDDHNPQYLVTVLQDVTERKRWEQRLAHMAHYDHLTDLPNRITFNDAMEATLELAAKTSAHFAVLSLDLDGFKEANDTYGHSVGDALLREVSRRLQEAAAGAFAARIGGDEFALIVTDAALPEAAEALADRVLKTLREDIYVEGRRIPIGATIGGAIYPKDAADIQALMINADIALYRAKADARGSLLLFDAEMGNQSRERRALHDDLSSAIERRELVLHYQPQKRLSGEAVGFEALIRWQSAERGMVPPGAFVPVAEETGLIGPIGDWVLREACREAASWPAPLTIAVNVSPIQFRGSDLPRRVHSILLETGLAPSRLELEITEGVLINDFAHAMSILARLKSLGVRIALDDFGTGYSSLSYLHAFSFDKIKIDRAFIGDLEHSQHSIAIVRAVIDLGHSLNIPVLAEGVETAEQHAVLFRKGCDEVQGYFTGRPGPIEAYADLVGRDASADSAFRKAS